jgi:hypothetical protein
LDLGEPDPGEGDGVVTRVRGFMEELRLAGGVATGHDSEEDLGSNGEVALIKKKIKFSSYTLKFRVEQLQSHI